MASSNCLGHQPPVSHDILSQTLRDNNPYRLRIMRAVPEGRLENDLDRGLIDFDVPNRRLLFLRDDSPVQIRNFGLLGIRPGLPTLLKKIERFFDPWSQNADRLERSDHSSTHIDQIALLLA